MHMAILGHPCHCPLQVSGTDAEGRLVVSLDAFHIYSPLALPGIRREQKDGARRLQTSKVRSALGTVDSWVSASPL